MAGSGQATATELPPVICPHKDGEGSSTITIRSFSLSSNNVTVELCSVGASITRLLLPSFASKFGDATPKIDDCVLGYDSPQTMHETSNPHYLGVVVGRVANRIAQAKFRLRQHKDDVDERSNKSPTSAIETDIVTYELDSNNGPHHLHGGMNGFGKQMWDGSIVDVSTTVAGEGTEISTKGVQFTLLSPDADQNYPGSVLTTATYTLLPRSTPSKNDDGAVLRLKLHAKLQNSHKATPINLAQHTYFNLNSHSSPHGILDHVITMPSECYTPTDFTSIPTTEVRTLDKDPTMDFRRKKVIRDALVEFGMDKAGLTEDEATKNVTSVSSSSDNTYVAKSAADCTQMAQLVPYGYDHNYVVLHKREENPPQLSSVGSRTESRLSVAGIVEHPPTKRRMVVKTNAPGVQLYTSNYLNGTDVIGKNGVAYGQWQGLCLETQHYPNSILPDEEREEELEGEGEGSGGKEFSKGRCFILRPGGNEYVHNVEYHFEPMNS